MAVPARGEDGVGALVEVEGVGRGREAEGGGRQVRRHEEHERRHSAGRRRRVRRGDELIGSAHHKTHRPSTIRGKCRQLVPIPRWLVAKALVANVRPKSGCCSLALSFLTIGRRLNEWVDGRRGREGEKEGGLDLMNGRRRSTRTQSVRWRARAHPGEAGRPRREMAAGTRT